MKALCWHGKNDVRLDTVDDPKIEQPDDIIIKVTATAICGSDLHILDGMVPTMKAGDILGHEFMGEVVEIGSNINRLKMGQKVVVPFTISCGHCFFCEKDLFSLCDESNPKAEIAIKQMGHATAGIFGYSHMTGGIAGGQAEYVRVPYGDVGPIVAPQGIEDDKVLFLSDIFPTGYMAAENANIQPGDTVAVWGCGPVGQFTIKSAWMLGAGRVIAIDGTKERVELAKRYGNAEVIQSTDADEVYHALMDMTRGRGPDSCIDAVGAEAHGSGIIDAIIDQAKNIANIPFPHPHVIQQIAKCCRKGGTLSIPGVYVGFANMIPLGTIMNKALTIKTGQTHVQKYLDLLMNKILDHEIDLSEIITHRLKLNDIVKGYELFKNKKDGCIKIFMTP